MTGGFQHPADSNGERHRRALVTLDDGSDVSYRDVRRFGTWLLLEPGELQEYLDARIGGEPLERAFTTAAFGKGLAGRRAPIKSALLDQRSVAGVGNIYADEALWFARIHPLRPAGELMPEEVSELRGRSAGPSPRHRAPGGDALRLPRLSGTQGPDAARVQGLRPCREAV